jgi:hypothetical protein
VLLPPIFSCCWSALSGFRFQVAAAVGFLARSFFPDFLRCLHLRFHGCSYCSFLCPCFARHRHPAVLCFPRQGRAPDQHAAQEFFFPFVGCLGGNPTEFCSLPARSLPCMLSSLSLAAAPRRVLFCCCADLISHLGLSTGLVRPLPLTFCSTCLCFDVVAPVFMCRLCDGRLDSVLFTGYGLHLHSSSCVFHS